jgi:gliding motility-associated-like protein
MYRHAVVLIFCLVVWNVNRSNAQLVLNSSDGLPDLGRSNAVWADFNNDGLLDVAITGINNAGSKQAGVYFNNNNGTFSNSGIALTAISDGDLAVNDYNNDGNIDLLLMGVDAAGTKQTKLYKNEGSGVFTALALSLEGLGYGAAVFTDLNNDGKADLLLNGLNNLNQTTSACYLNNGNGTFTLKTTAIVASSYGDLLSFDYNNDGYLDVLVSGLNANNQRIMHLYQNKGAGTFVKIETVLPALRSGGLAAADMDNDGFIDLFISGSSSGATNHAAVYKNNAGTGFVLLKTLAEVSDGTGAWGDYNNDGYADLALFGFDKTDLQSIIYQNVGGADFVDSGVPLPGASQGQAVWMDYNKDNRLDFLLTGYSSIPFTSIYTSTVAAVNAIPAAPTNLSFTAFADSVILSWDAPIDPETNAAGLTYNLYIGSSSQAFDVKAPLAYLATGLRKVASMGEVKQTKWILPKLAEGTYYWSVQAIDPAFGASPFSSEATFVSCAPLAITGTDKVCRNQQLTLHAGVSGDAVTWYSMVHQHHQIGTGMHLSYTLSTKDTIVAKVVKPIGCTLYDTLRVDVFALPALDAGIDKSNCLNKSVSFEVQTTASTVRWWEEGHHETILYNTKTISIPVIRTQQLIVEAEDANHCTMTDTVNVGVYPQPVVHLGNDPSVCFGTEWSGSTGLPSDSVNWFSEHEGLLLKDQGHYAAKIIQADKLWAEVFNTEGCVSYDTISITVFALPEAIAGNDQLICNDQSIAIGKELANAAGLSFLWNPSSSLSAANVSNPLASPLLDTKYILLVTDANHCENRDTVWVYLNPSSIVNAGHDVSVCIGDRITLGGNPSASGSNLVYHYQWTRVDGLDDAMLANPKVSPSQTTTYTLEAMAGNCPAGSASVTITVNALPTVVAGEDLTIGAEQSVTLSVHGALSYQWFPEEFFVDGTSDHPVVYPNRTTVYRVKGKDVNGCNNTDTVKVTVRSELFVPSLFTPNDDDINTIFRAHGFGVKQIALKVYDRWGRQVFESNALEKGWDGYYNGQPVESGNYIWTVEGEFFDGNALQYQGQKRGVIKLMR